MNQGDAASGRPSDSVSDNVLICMRKIIQSIDINSRDLVRKVGLTGPQLVILQEVAATGEISVGKIARAISLSQATVTGIVERLEKRELILRRRSDTDRRCVLVQATPLGMETLEKARPHMQESFVRKFRALPDWEQSMILCSLQRIVAIMDAKPIQAAPILTTGPIDAGNGGITSLPLPDNQAKEII